MIDNRDNHEHVKCGKHVSLSISPNKKSRVSSFSTNVEYYSIQSTIQIRQSCVLLEIPKNLGHSIRYTVHIEEQKSTGKIFLVFAFAARNHRTAAADPL